MSALTPEPGRSSVADVSGAPLRGAPETHRPANGSEGLCNPKRSRLAGRPQREADMATTVKHSSNDRNGGSAAEHYAPIGRVEIASDGVLVEATFVHPDIVLYAESGGLGLDALGSAQALLVAGINASRSVGAYALAA